MKILALVVASFALVGTASANELVVTAGKAKAASVLSLDMVSSGDAAAFQAVIETGIKDASLVDLSGCVTAINAAGRSGSCAFKDGQVRLAVFSADGSTLPKGAVSIGKIVLKTAGAATSVSNFEAFDKVGYNVAASTANVQ